MKKKAVLANLSSMSRDELGIIQNLTRDEHKSTSGVITKDQVIASLKNEGTKKVEENINRSIAFEELENSVSDLSMAKRIIISNLVCPDDMTNTVLEFKLDKFNMDSSIKTQILDTVKHHLNEHYDFENRQYEIVEKSLFDKGAFCQAIIPNEAYMKATAPRINGHYAYESDIGYKREKDEILGVKLSNNSTVNFNFTTDLSKLKLKKKSLSLRLEDDLNGNNTKEEDKTLDKLVEALLKRNDTSGYEELIRVDNVERTEGIPLILDLPCESIIPVCDPATPELHYGYFIMLDREGNPLNKNSMRYNSVNRPNVNIQGYVYGAKELDPFTSNTALGSKPVKTDTHAPLSYETFKTTIEEATNTAIKKLLQERDMDDHSKNLIMRTMFSRTLANKETQILYIPETMMVYYAFEYGEDGVGRSVYTGMSELLAMKKYLLIVSYLGYLDELIPNTNIEVDITDVPANNIEKYIEEVKHVYLQSKVNPFVNLAESPYDITELVRRHGVTINLLNDGMGGNMPKATVDVRNRELPEVNEELFRILDNMIYNKLGVLASVIQDGYENEYAVLVSGKQKIIAKINAARVEIHNVNMTDHIRKVIHNDGRLKKQIRNIVADKFEAIVSGFNSSDTTKSILLDKQRREDVIDILMKKIILNMTVSIPQPQSETDEMQVERIKNYSDAIGDLLDNVMSDEAFPSELYGEKASEKANALKGVIKYKLILDALKTMPYFQNVSVLLNNFTSDAEKDEITRMITGLQQTFAKKLLSSYNTIQVVASKTDGAIDQLEERQGVNGEENDSGSSDDGGSDGGGDYGDDNDDGDDGSGDDGGMGIEDFSMDDFGDDGGEEGDDGSEEDDEGNDKGEEEKDKDKDEGDEE